MSFTAIAGIIGSIGVSAAGSETASASTVAGAETKAEQTRLGQVFQTKQFEKAIERQQPFLQAGQEASPLLTLAIRNELETSNLPATEIRKGLVSAGIEEAPEFVKERVGRGIEATEAESQKSRLLDLVKIGLGAAGSVTGARAGLGVETAESLGKIGRIGAGALQSAATQRQNTITTAAERFGGLPAFLASQRKRTGGQPLVSGFAESNTGQFVPVA